MMEITIRATECDVCEQHKLCWHVSSADVCAGCLDVASNIIAGVDDFGFVGESPKPTKPAKKKAA